MEKRKDLVGVKVEECNLCIHSAAQNYELSCRDIKLS